MKKTLLLISLLAILAFACAPTVVSKCRTDYAYEGDKIKSTYQECITQNPGDKPHITLKHQELFD
ncbi:MAG: hypothetical protein Q8M71_01920 [Thermodesulfovibrionales bacterium]|nr:hypothetical protein [Thermodesulfovibrionales bacterium]